MRGWTDIHSVLQDKFILLLRQNTIEPDPAIAAFTDTAPFAIIRRKAAIAQALAEKLGVCRPTLYNWKNQLLGPEAPATMKRKNNSPPVQERSCAERTSRQSDHSVGRSQSQGRVWRDHNTAQVDAFLRRCHKS
jgi:hypothetical protein